MKLLLIFICCCTLALTVLSQQKEVNRVNKPDTTKKMQIAEASCGQCQFGLKGKGCDLAVRINGKAYFVDGSHIDSHGNAHAKEGFCNAIRKAEVLGRVVNNRFVASYFKLIKQNDK
jgi:hypothetical protein